MKLTTETYGLMEGLSIVTRALAVRSAKPIFEGVLMEAGEEGLILTCSDGNMTIQTALPAMIEEEGRTVLPGRLFNDLARKLPGSAVTLKSEDGSRMSIRSERFRSTLSGMNPMEYPEMPEVEPVVRIEMKAQELRDMISRTAFCVATDESRQTLNGVLLEVTANEMRMVALDGFRLALRRAKISDVLENFSAIIPGRAVGDIGKLLSDDPEAFASLSFGGNKLHIRLEKTEIFVILVEGEYVQYRQILPPRFATRVVVDLEPFRKGIDRAALIAREGNNNLLILKIAGGEMAIESHSQIGDVFEKLEIQQEGADLNIAFNVKYLTDVVRYIDAEQIEINLNNAISPCIITPVGDSDYVHLVLPVRTGATA